MSCEPKPSLPRHIHSPIDHYDLDVSTGTITYHVVTTNGDRIRSMTDEELAHLLHTAEEHIFSGNLWDYEQWQTWLKSPVEVSE